MKLYRFSLEAFLATLTALAFFCLTTVAFAAGDDRQCSVTFTTGVAGTTAVPTTGTCTWGAGSTLLMQCDQDVYFSGTTTATSTDFQVKFSVNPDPYLIYMLDTSGGSGTSSQKNVSVLGVSASGTCKFAKTNRRKPI